MSDPKILDRSGSLDPDKISLIHNLKKGATSANYLQYEEQRYNDLIIAIIRQGGPGGGHHGSKFNLVMRYMQITTDIMSQIAKLAEAQKKLKSGDQYQVTHVMYLRTLSEFHDTISSQAYVVIEILRDIEKKARLRKAKEMSIFGDDGEAVIIGNDAENHFPDNPELSASQDDIEIVKDIYNHHKELQLYVANIRAEIINCLTDNKGLSSAAQALALQSISRTLGAVIGANRPALLKQYEEAYSITRYLDEHTPTKWCHVSKKFYDCESVKNAHVIPAATPSTFIRDIFGDPEPAPILKSPRNFVFMYQSIEEAFDEGRISIVPVVQDSQRQSKSNFDSSTLDESANPMQFRLLFIDRSLITSRKSYMSYGDTFYRWHELAKNPVLQFLNDSRPGLRNLFWHCITSLGKAKDQQFPGYVDALKEFETVWTHAITGKWIARNVLEGLATRYSIPEIIKTDAYLDETEIKDLNELYTVESLSWQSPHQREDVDLSFDNGVDQEYTFPFLGPQSFLSPRVVKLNDDIDATGIA